MDIDFSSALSKQVERLASAVERQNALLEGQTVQERPPSHLSLFLERLSTRNYESLRLKLIPVGLASKILGISPAELFWLDNNGFIKQSEDGLYDVLSILMWLDDEKPGGFHA